jgi:hypothetical protein
MNTEILIKCSKNDITLFDGITLTIFNKILEEIAKFRPVLSVLDPYMPNASVAIK